MAKTRVTRDNFLENPQGKSFADVVNDPEQPFDSVLEFFNDADRQRRMEESEIHHDRPALAGVRFGLFLAASVVGAGVAGVQFFPAVDYVTESSRRVQTTRAEAKHMEIGFECGCDDFVTKPLKGPELLDKIRQYLHA